jgi:hypothetical protein
MTRADGWRFLRWGVACLFVAAIGVVSGCGGGGGGGGGGGADDGALKGDFFPLAVGDRWTYAGDGEGTMSVRATGLRQIDGRQGVVVTVDDAVEGRSEFVYVVTDDGVREVPGSSSDPLLAAIGPVQVMRFPLVPGDSFVQIDKTISTGTDFDGDGRIEQAQVHSEVSVVGAESVTTPAGAFTGAAHLRTRFTVSVPLTGLGSAVVITTTSDDWFAPGVGPVRSVIEIRSDGATERSEWAVVAYRAGAARSEQVAPAVVSVRPVDGGVQGGAANVVVNFSEPMDAVSLATAITLTDPTGQPVPLTVTTSGSSASVVPADAWVSGRYSAQVSTAAEDRAGNALAAAQRWAFDIDLTVPALLSSTPADGATEVALDAPVVLRFSEAIAPESLVPGAVQLVHQGNTVPATVTLDGSVLTVTPSLPLERAELYEVHVYDSLLDLAGNRLPTDVVVGFRADSGRFALPQALAPAGHIEAVAIGDLNGDGRADVVMSRGYSADPQDFGLLLRRQLPDGSLAAAQVLDTRASYGCPARSLVIGDLDGDGRQDLLVGESGCGIEIFRQGSDGVLRAAGFIDSAESGRLRLADLNRDGRPDLVAAGFYGSVLRIWLQSADGTMVLHASPAFEYAGDADLDIGDINGDGRPDIAIGNGSYPDASIGIFLQHEDGGFGPATTRTPSPPTGVAALAVGDVNGDGRDDVVVTYGGNGGRLGVMLQRLDGSLGPMNAMPSYDVPSQVEVADVNGDGRRDVVVGHSGWFAVGVYLQQADGKLRAEARYRANYGNNNPGSMAVGDVTGDGRPDVLVAEALLRQKVVDMQALGVGRPGSAVQAITRIVRQAVPAAKR